MQRIIRGLPYFPTSPRSGSGGDAIFRMQNFIRRGGESGSRDLAYWECFAGPENLSETIATSTLTGTLSLTANSKTIAGAGTAFTTELHLGQFVLANDPGNSRSFLLVVEEIISTTSIKVSRAPSATVSGLTGYRTPVIFSYDRQRGTAIRGKVERTDKGTLFSVGDGTFRVNGSALSATLALTRAPKISLLNSGAGTYTHYTLGMPTPAAPVLTAVAGGTKGMQPAAYSVVITSERKETLGFNNPSPRADVTIAAGQRVQITFAAMNAASGQNAWGVWVTRYVDSIGAGRDYLNGPWYRYMQVTDADVSSAGGNYNVEWLDAEVEGGANIVTFDNDAPPAAEFVALFNGIPVYISTHGAGDTSPGPFVSPAKLNNVEAAPAELAIPTSPPEVIIGVEAALGRLYVLTPNHLQITQGTNNPDYPVILRPYWDAGFINPYQLAFASGILYGATTAGPARSVGDGDELEAERTWAAPISEFVQQWVMGHVMVRIDPLNNCACYFHSAWSLNSSGFWTTRVWMWSLSQQEWVGDILLSSTTTDMIVTGVATIGNYLEFLCGGRKSDNTVEVNTYRFDTATGSSVPYYMAANYSDSGEELRPKKVGPAYITAKLTSSTFKVYAVAPGETVDVSALEAGTSSDASLSLATSTSITAYGQKKFNVKNAKQHTVRIDGTWAGSGSKDRIEEIVYEAEVQGSRR